jgi:long-chain fatty acid transport protein
MRVPVALVTLLLAPPAKAAGFILNEQSAAATGRAGAVVARPDHPSAIFWNPAGIAALPGINAYVGVNAVSPKASFTDATDDSTTDATTPMAYTPNAYATYRINGLLSAGIGINSPFGLGVEWPETSPGRQVVREQALRTFFISPVVGADLSELVPGLLVGGGVDVVPAQVYLSRDVVFGDSVGTAEIGGSALGFGGRIGVSYSPEPLPALAVGVAYRSPVRLSFSGDANFTIDQAYRDALPADGDVSTEITLPQSVLGGVSYAPVSALTLEVDVNWIDWSAYDDLVVDLPGDDSLTSTRDWNDTIVVRAGAEYRMGELALRAGYAYDPTPVPDETLDFTLPDIDRNVVTLGAGYALPMGLTVDVAGLYVLPAKHTTSDAANTPRYKGTYDVSAWVLALGIGFALDSETNAAAKEPVGGPVALLR